MYKPMTTEEVAMGFIEVANETMCRPIRALTQVRAHFLSRVCTRLKSMLCMFFSV